MASLIPDYGYDIFISYRQKDNKYDGWVTEFVDNLKKELEATFKEEISVYLDVNPHDGLLETHIVDVSLKEKLKCLVFIPVISQTYCDPKSFAWQHEFVAFNNMAKNDFFKRDIRLLSGNVASRILPVQIHDLDPEDKELIEKELGGELRCIEFIYKSAGVNRPLRANEDHPQDNLNKTYYRDQINKVANAVKEIINALKKPKRQSAEGLKAIIKPNAKRSKSLKIKFFAGSLLVLSLILIGYFINLNMIVSKHHVEKSIAVLPFIDDSPNANEESMAFVNGITDEILIDLQRINVFRVISRTSVEQFRGLNKRTIPEIAKKLGVNYIVEGSAQKYGNKFRLRIQLIRADNESNLWAKSYEQEINNVSDIFSIQSRIAESIASELEAEITPEEKQLIEKTPTDNPEAYRLYNIGNYFMSRWGEDNFRKAINNYKQAIALDSSFAEAYANLASAYFELTMWDVPKPYPEFIPHARKWALKALELNKKLGEAYFVLGAIKYIHLADYKEAERDFKKGMELSPNYVWGRINYANFLTAMRRFEESISISRETVKINPLDPGTYVELAYPLAHIGQEKEALELYNKSLELQPNYFNAIGCLIEFYSNKGILNQFLSDQIDTLLGSPHADFRKIPTDNLIEAGKIFAKVGHNSEALDIINELNSRVEKGEPVSNIGLGFLYYDMGEYEKAIDFFERGFNNKESGLFINISCVNDSIRSNRRFQELLRKMGFEN